MANKKKAASVKNNKGATLTTSGNVSDTPHVDVYEKYWPQSFASPRRTAFLVAASLLVAVMVFPTALFGGFTALKISLAEWLNLTNPELVSPANFDVACVLWAMATVLFLGLIHPCLGVGFLLLLRPWLDGYTFFSDNVYFTWSIYLLCFLWLIQVIKGNMRIYAPPQMWLLTALMVVFLLVTRFSYQYFNTYQHLWLWLGYIMLFLLVINTTRDKAAWAAVVTIFLLGVGVEALFSVLHFEYLLPHLRKMIQDPAMLQRYFGTTTISPEMARRFNVNRAFGSMLFPNALAAYLLLAIPFAFTSIMTWWRDANETLKRKSADVKDGATPAGRIMLLAVAIVFGIGCFVAIFFVTYFPRTYVYDDSVLDPPFYLKTAPLTVLAFIAACCTALSLLLVLSRYGLDGFWYLLRFTSACVLTPLLVYSLWITYSRGAYLGLFFAAIWGLFLLLVSAEHLQYFAAMLKSRKKTVALMLILCFMALTAAAILDFGTASYAQQPAAAPVDARTQVHQQGISLTASDLADPASLRLRFGYWHVAARIAMDNLLTGVGLGNFAIAYPAYQYIGAGDVREAHNGFLQLFAETGIFGGLLFLAFWVYFGLWGAWRIINEKDRREKLLLVGMYAGIVAFCAHAFVDIDFSHPSLVMFVMVFTALFYARAARNGENANDESVTRETSAKKRWLPLGFHRIMALSLVLLLIVSSIAVFRAYAQQLVLSRFNFINVSDNGELSKRMRAGQFFIAELTQFGRLQRQGQKPQKNPRIVIPMARLFLDDYEAFADACVFYKPSPDTRNRFLKLEPGEAVPTDGLMIVARDAFRIRDAALEDIASWISEMKRMDALFPHHHELALNIIKWYELHVDYVFGPAFKEKRAAWIEQYLLWCKILKDRNPYHADVRMFHAQALLRAALIFNNEQTQDLIEQVLAEWQVVMELTPITAGHKHAFAAALSAMSDYYQQQGKSARAEEFGKRSAAMRKKAQEMDEKRAQARLYQ